MLYEGRTPLHYAAHAGNLEVVRWLINNGALHNIADEMGLTPMDYAAQRGHWDIVKLLGRLADR